ncbi:MAG TPA: PKD domain-containing protein [Vicinamibacterales bacterium]|nr:PKD domain-containing protein [Vicinamibacterales bacterium]
MLTHLRRALPLVAIASGLLLPIVVSSCDKVPLLAPTGTTINLFATSNTVSLNSSIDVIATAIENGTDVGGGSGTTTSTAGAGTPVQNGTLISFTTTIGNIQPSEARTHNGQVTVQLVTGSQSGTATITAYSGGASKTLQVKVGTAAASRISVTASPQSLGSAGGTSTISAAVTDDGGAPVSGIPVSFSTDQGTLSAPTANTDGSGVATTLLTTTATATVTATAGAATAVTTKVNVGARLNPTIIANPAATTAGTPVTFNITTASTANIRDALIEFGDGDRQDLGAIGAQAQTSHTYTDSGQFTARVTVTDATGATEFAVTTVTIGSLPVSLAASPNPVKVNNPTVLTATVPGGTQIESYTFTFDDNTAPVTTASNTTPHTFTTRGTHIVRVDVVAVGGATGRNLTQVAVQ